MKRCLWPRILWLLMLTDAAVAASDFRLAGTMSYGNNQWLAMVELPSGKQRLVKVNESLAGGTVVAIGDRVVRVRFAEGDKIYVLEGGKTIATWSVPQRPADAPIVSSREIGDAFLKSLLELEQSSSKSDPQVLRAELNKLLGIPPSARVRAVNRDNIRTDAQLIATIRREVRARNAVHLFLDNSPQLTEVYLMPSR